MDVRRTTSPDPAELAAAMAALHVNNEKDEQPVTENGDFAVQFGNTTFVLGVKNIQIIDEAPTVDQFGRPWPTAAERFSPHPYYEALRVKQAMQPIYEALANKILSNPDAFLAPPKVAKATACEEDTVENYVTYYLTKFISNNKNGGGYRYASERVANALKIYNKANPDTQINNDTKLTRMDFNIILMQSLYLEEEGDDSIISRKTLDELAICCKEWIARSCPGKQQSSAEKLLLWVSNNDFLVHLKNYDDFCVLATKLDIDDASIPSIDDYNTALENDLYARFGAIYDDYRNN